MLVRIILMLLMSGLVANRVAADPMYPPRVWVSENVARQFKEASRQPLGGALDEADALQSVLAVYSIMKPWKKRWIYWITPSEMIVRTFTGGVGGEVNYLCVVRKRNGKWQLDEAYWLSIYD